MFALFFLFQILVVVDFIFFIFTSHVKWTWLPHQLLLFHHLFLLIIRFCLLLLEDFLKYPFTSPNSRCHCLDFNFIIIVFCISQMLSVVRQFLSFLPLSCLILVLFYVNIAMFKWFIFRFVWNKNFKNCDFDEMTSLYFL